jgi:hypothetical protein
MTKKARSKAQKRVKAEASDHPVRTAPRPKKEAEEFAVEWDAIQQMEKDVNPQQVNEVTDHVFQSVLSRFGWMRNEQGQFEKAGTEEAA